MLWKQRIRLTIRGPSDAEGGFRAWGQLGRRDGGEEGVRGAARHGARARRGEVRPHGHCGGTRGPAAQHQGGQVLCTRLARWTDSVVQAPQGARVSCPVTASETLTLRSSLCALIRAVTESRPHRFVDRFAVTLAPFQH